MNPIIKMLKKSTSDYVPADVPVRRGSDSSRTGLIVPELIFRYGDKSAIFSKIPRIARWLFPAIRGRMEGYKSLKKNPLAPLTRADDRLMGELREFVTGLGCHDMGFASVPDSLIFKDKSILYSHAIVLSMPMEKSCLVQAPGIKSGREVWRIYKELGDASNRTADFLRDKGYAAQAGAALGGDINYPLLAQNAGLGWIGKHGLLISPGTGPSQRLAVVFTSIDNLPHSRENVHSWIGRFCDTCGRCVRLCPGKAIYDEKPIQTDGGPRHIDYLKCIGPFSETMGCSLCIKECVFFRGDYNKIKKNFLNRGR